MIHAIKDIPNLTSKQINKFWSKIGLTANDNKCWNWNGAVSSGGYGCVRIENKLYNSHRIAYSISNNAQSFSLCVCHSCDNTLCCNPKHLFLGTSLDNMIDRDLKLRFNHSEKNPMTTLKNEDVILMRNLHKEGVSIPEIAKRFNSRYNTTYQIIKGKRWLYLN